MIGLTEGRPLVLTMAKSEACEAIALMALVNFEPWRSWTNPRVMGSIPVTGTFVCNIGQVAYFDCFSPPRSILGTSGGGILQWTSILLGGVILLVAYNAIETRISSNTDGPQGNSPTVTDLTFFYLVYQIKRTLWIMWYLNNIILYKYN